MIATKTENRLKSQPKQKPTNRIIQKKDAKVKIDVCIVIDFSPFNIICHNSLFLSSRCFEFFVQFIKRQSKGVTCHDKVINRTAIIIDIRSLKSKILIKFLDYFLNQLEISTQLISFLTFAELQTNLKLNDIKELSLLLA